MWYYGIEYGLFTVSNRNEHVEMNNKYINALVDKTTKNSFEKFVKQTPVDMVTTFYGSHPIITTQYEIVLIWPALHTCAAQHRSDDDKPPMPKSLICSQRRVNLLMVFVMFTQRAINEINLA